MAGSQKSQEKKTEKKPTYHYTFLGYLDEVSTIPPLLSYVKVPMHRLQLWEKEILFPVLRVQTGREETLIME